MTNPYLNINKGIFEMWRSIKSLVFLLHKSICIDNKIELKLGYVCGIIFRSQTKKNKMGNYSNFSSEVLIY